MPYTGLVNFRDIGGHPLRGGGRMTTGVVFRSGRFDAVDPAHADGLLARRVGTIIDLRTDEERSAVGRPARVYDRMPGLEVINLPFFRTDGRPSVIDMAGRRDRSWAPEDLAVRYAAMVAGAGRPALASIIRTISEPSARPTVVHCWSGKDRTGVTAAVLQSITGVADEVIGADYAATADWFAAHLDAHPELRVATHPGAYEPRAETMVMTLDALRDSFGSLEEMLVSSGLDEGRLDRAVARLSEP